MSAKELEKFIVALAGLDRSGVISILRRLKCGFTIDFTDEFLESVELDKLRHIALAAGLRAEDTPM